MGDVCVSRATLEVPECFRGFSDGQVSDIKSDSCLASRPPSVGELSMEIQVLVLGRKVLLFFNVLKCLSPCFPLGIEFATNKHILALQSYKPALKRGSSNPGPEPASWV